MKQSLIENIIRVTIREVYSEKQRKWACVQAGLPAHKRQKSLSKKEAEEMCRDTKISKKPMKEAEETTTPASAAQARQYGQTTQFRRETGEVGWLEDHNELCPSCGWQCAGRNSGPRRQTGRGLFTGRLPGPFRRHGRARCQLEQQKRRQPTCRQTGTSAFRPEGRRPVFVSVC